MLTKTTVWFCWSTSLSWMDWADGSGRRQAVKVTENVFRQDLSGITDLMQAIHSATVANECTCMNSDGFTRDCMMILNSKYYLHAFRHRFMEFVAQVHTWFYYISRTCVCMNSILYPWIQALININAWIHARLRIYSGILNSCIFHAWMNTYICIYRHMQ